MWQNIKRHYFCIDLPFGLALFSEIFKNLLVLSVAVELCVLTLFAVSHKVHAVLYLWYRTHECHILNCLDVITRCVGLDSQVYLSPEGLMNYLTMTTFSIFSTFKIHSQSATDLGMRVDKWIWESSLKENLWHIVNVYLCKWYKNTKKVHHKKAIYS